MPSRSLPQGSGPKGDSGAERSVVLGTAGHIDHGKTALVLALTGTDTDRLPEEKARGITIDLGFAAMDLQGPAGEQLHVSLIDVPGHHAFVRNMLAGAGGIDAVMLVIAADEGVKAQTLEHLQICSLLGLERGVVVLTKLDAVDETRLAAARLEVAALVRGTFLESAPVLAVSALRQQGLPAMRKVLGELLSAMPRRTVDQVARLPVDRVFSVRGFGTVVTGTLQAGTFRAGQGLTLEPGTRPVRVRGLQVHGAARAEAAAPNRVALNLAGVEVSEVHRGAVVVPEGQLEPTSVVDVLLEALPEAPAPRHRSRVRVHAFAAESPASVLLYAPDEDILAGAPVLARLRLAKPMLLVPGDRFVVRQLSPALTVGGGRVLDAHPLPRLRKSTTGAFLRPLLESDQKAEVTLRVERRGLCGIQLREMIAETGRTGEALARTLAMLASEGKIVAAPGGAAWVAAGALRHGAGLLQRCVLAAKEQTTTRAALRGETGLDGWVFALALDRLLAAKTLELQGETVRIVRASGPAGNTRETNAAAAVERLYREAGLASPLVNEAGLQLQMSAAEMRASVTSLLRTGALVRLGSDALLVHRDALAQLTAQLRTEPGQTLDVARFKTLTGLTRKHAIPLLEYLDGARVTRKAGSTRVVV